MSSAAPQGAHAEGQLVRVKRAPRVLSASAVKGFLLQYQETWTALELPLPERMDQQEFGHQKEMRIGMV